MIEQELEAEQQRLHKVGQATVQRMRDLHGMSHKFPTGPMCYAEEPVPFRGVVKPCKPRTKYLPSQNEPEPQAAAPDPTFPKRSEVYCYEPSGVHKPVLRDRAQNAGLQYFLYRGEVFNLDMELICLEGELQDE